MRNLGMLTLILLLASAPAAAQTGSQDESASREVLGVVHRMFDAMHAKDTAAMGALLAPGARLVTTGTRDGQPIVRTTHMSDFLKIIADAEPELEERIFDPEVRVDDNLATVWTRYEFLLDGKADHCGVDAFQLARTAEGWRIIAIADTQRPCGDADAGSE